MCSGRGRAKVQNKEFVFALCVSVHAVLLPATRRRPGNSRRMAKDDVEEEEEEEDLKFRTTDLVLAAATRQRQRAVAQHLRGGGPG